MKQYQYNDQIYTSLYDLRNAIWFNERSVFGEFNDDIIKKFNITITESSASEVSLTVRKSQKLNQLDRMSHKFDNNLVCDDMIITSSLGFRANADLRSQNNIDSLISLNTEPVQFRDADNVFHALTLENLKTLKQECVANGVALYQQKWNYIAKIQAAETEEELNNINFNFVMQDFS